LNLTFEQLIVLFTFIDTIILGIFALMRTYYNRKSVQIQGTMLRESRIYWNSWKERSEDISKKVKKDIEKEVRTQLKELANK